jgi:hypothetical protein
MSYQPEWAQRWQSLSPFDRNTTKSVAATTAGFGGLLSAIIAIVFFVLIVLAWSHAKNAANLIQSSNWDNPALQSRAYGDAIGARNFAGVVWIIQLIAFLFVVLMALLAASYLRK